MASQQQGGHKTEAYPIRGTDSIRCRSISGTGRTRSGGFNRSLGNESFSNIQRQNPNKVYETDPVTLVRRQRQLDYGKKTDEYQNFIRAVPKSERIPAHPKTPDRYQKASRRCWDGQVRVWRLLLHAWGEDDIKTSPSKATAPVNEEVIEEKMS